MYGYSCIASTIELFGCQVTVAITVVHYFVMCRTSDHTSDHTVSKGFTVTRRCSREMQPSTSEEQEKMHCSLCGVCPMYVSCSCADAVKSGISCKHAHAWALNYDVIEGSEEEVVSLSDKRKELVTELQEIVDRLSFSWSTRPAVDENRIASLMRTRDLLLQAANEELGGLRKPVLIPRRECPTRGRKVLTKQAPVRRMVKSKCAAEYTGNIVADELNICVLCDDTHPPLEDPKDEPVMEGADILWWSCRVVVHGCTEIACSVGNCPVCDGVFEPTG
ncbi:unnamed protein product [Cylicocyclus nassatus]|uniref:SWIM-type domain-containing protein n=1 Tax=Cylicocyclus nassatus TaxID=53992 RepID=A0AA36DN04_CYLNA|nr:unnamed protein product [Cylicocyclus nassatus]